MIRWWFTLLYCTALLIGTLIIGVRRAPLLPDNYVAATTLQRGRLLQPGDLLPRATLGRYLPETVLQGQIVRLDQARAIPSLTVTKGLLTVAVPVSLVAVEAGEANAGAAVLLCGPRPGEAVSGPDRVQAANCAPGEDACIALIDVPTADVAALSALQASPKVVDAAKCP